ncbi:MAG: hypothetical protein OWQ55_08115 [Sulfuracidifex metallicus]|nr:hypothetical protein [Sulfuracidifex metallicus]
MVQDPFTLLSYLVEHANEGSIIPLKVSGNVLFLIKDGRFTFSIYILEGEDIARIRKDFLPTNLHKVIYEVIDDLKERLSSDLSDLQIAKEIDATKFLETMHPRREERREERRISRKPRERKEAPVTNPLDSLRIRNNVHLYPLLKLGTSFFSIVLETTLGEMFNLPNASPFMIKDGNTIPYQIKNLKSIYVVLSQAKMDTFRERNPIAEVQVENNRITFFSAMFLDEGKGEGKDFTFIGRKAKGVEKDYMFFRLSNKGSVRTISRKVISVSQDVNLGVGFFFWDGQTIVRTGGLDLLKSHEQGIMTLNEYILLNSLLVSNSLSLYSKVMTSIMNMGVSKRIPSHLVKDIMDIDSNPMSISPLVENVIQDEVRFYDPVEYWYSTEILGESDPIHCKEISHYIELRKSVIGELKNRGWFKDFLI